MKPDKSPVTSLYLSFHLDFGSNPTLTSISLNNTVADLSAQSLISLHLLHHYPSDLIIGEEDTTELRGNDSLREKVVGLVNVGFKREQGWGKDQEWSEDQWVFIHLLAVYLKPKLPRTPIFGMKMALADLDAANGTQNIGSYRCRFRSWWNQGKILGYRKYSSQATLHLHRSLSKLTSCIGSRRVLIPGYMPTIDLELGWKADTTKKPTVDGTSGFIRHQQYAVCLALIIDGIVEMGVIGCPNLGPEPAKIGEEVMPNGKGVLMVAVRGEGSYSVSFSLWTDGPIVHVIEIIN